MSRRGAWACALGLAALAPAVPAQAHTDLRASSPAAGAVVRDAPGAVVLTFAAGPGRVEAVEVWAGGGNVAGAARSDPRDARRVIVPLRARVAGPHRVAWSIRAADGDVVQGVVPFRVTGPAAAPGVCALGAAIARAARRLEVAAARR